MTTVSQTDFARNWRDIAANLLKLGATAYGGPAIMGIMQAELQEKRQWVSKERFVEGLSLVNMLPGATATQLGIFLGYTRGGWWGGLLGGLCFVLPAFFVMLALTIAYASLGVTPILRGALYCLTPGDCSDGLCGGPVAPGLILMVAEEVGCEGGVVGGAAVAAGAAYPPSFVLVRAVLAVLERVSKPAWTRAVMKGMGPAVIGVL